MLAAMVRRLNIEAENRIMLPAHHLDPTVVEERTLASSLRER
jgi:hypothetical protein